MNLLDTLVVTQGQKKVNQILKRQMEEKFQTYFKDIKNNSLGSKVELLVDFLNEEGYMVEVKETPTAYILEEHNCALERWHKSIANSVRTNSLFFNAFSMFPWNASAIWLPAITVVVMLFPRPTTLKHLQNAGIDVSHPPGMQ